MRRRLATAGALGLVAALVLSAGPGAADERAGRSTVGVRNGDDEFSFVLSRTKVRPGAALIQYVNTGEDAHDIVLKRKGGKRKHRSDKVKPGNQVSLELALRARSRYRLWCSIPGHKQRGMKAFLRVKRRS